MFSEEADVRRQAIDWLFVLNGPIVKASDLEAFEKWYAHHPSHAAAYHDVANLLGESLMVSHTPLTPGMLIKEERFNRIAFAALLILLLSCLAIVLEIPVAMEAG